MSLAQEPLNLRLAQPFTIARGTQLEANNVLVRATADGLEGLGEAAPSEHYGDTQATSGAFVQLAITRISGTEPLTRLQRLLEEIARYNPAPKAAIDMAAYDLLGKQLGVPVYRLLGLDPDDAPLTSFTIGIDEPEVMAQKAREASAYRILKVKVGTPRDVENLEAIRSVTNATIRVDANEAWTPKQAVAAIKELARFDIEFVEQPVVAQRPCRPWFRAGSLVSPHPRRRILHRTRRRPPRGAVRRRDQHQADEMRGHLSGPANDSHSSSAQSSRDDGLHD